MSNTRDISSAANSHTAECDPSGEAPIARLRESVSDPTIGPRLKQARVALGEDLHSLARRAGVPERQVRAIEDGRFDDLPRGIYARSAVRSYAAALGFDPLDALHDCELLLPPLEEPIRAMGRLKGVRSADRAPVPASSCESHLEREGGQPPDWRPCAAAAVDAALIGAILAMVIAGAAVTANVRIDALDGAAAFGGIGFLLAGVYFTFLGGLAGMTAGGRAVRLFPLSRESSPLDLREIATRAGRWAAGDLCFLWKAGVWLGRLTRGTSVDAAAPKHASDQRPAVST